jgi:DeoR/GlpR family transcriptional regulator of sugar metabolism
MADSTKFGKMCIFKLCRRSDVDVLFSDCDLSVVARKATRSIGTDMRVAGLEGRPL